MTQYVVFLVVGLGAGAVYAALATGLVAVHQATGVINFAQGAMAIWGAYVVDEVRSAGDLVLPIGRFHVGGGLWLALVLGLVSAAGIGLLVHLLVFRPLQRAPTLAKVVGSVGVMIVLQALIVVRFTTDARFVQPILPQGVVEWGGVSFPIDRIYLAVAAGLVALAFWGLYRYTRIGLATRAAAQNERAAMLSGHSPTRLAAFTWVLATVATSLVVILASPATGLDPTSLTLAVVPALACALAGRLSSMPIALVAGLALGAIQSEITFASSRPWWPHWAATGVADTIPLLIIIAALFAFGSRLPTRDTGEVESLPAVRRPRNRPPVVAATVGLGFVAILLTHGSYRFGLVTSMILALLALSLVVITGLVGQISLSQAAFSGIGGFALSKLTVALAVPFPLSMLIAASVAALAGVLIGIPSLRIRGAQLAVVTLATAVAVQQLVFGNGALVPADGAPIKAASVAGLDLAVRKGTDLVRLPFALMVLAVVALAMVFLGNVARGATGRAFLAVRSNERAAAAVGIDVGRLKLLGFALSSFLAGIAGCLLGYSRGILSPDSFTVLTSLSILAFAYLGGVTSVAGAIVAGLSAPLGIVYVLIDRNIDLGAYYTLVAGILLIATVIYNPEGVAGKTRENIGVLRDRVAAWRGA